MKKLLILGTSFGSVEIIQRAKAKKIHTIVTDYYDKEHSLAKQYADECWDISTSDLDTLEEKCRVERIDGILASVSQYNIEMQFHLCDRLNLPKYCTWEAWHYTRDKRDFKDLCIKWGVPVATDYYVSENLTDEELNKIKYPVVVKPVDQGGNAGITYCYNHSDLRKAYAYARSVSDNPKIVIERFLKGREYTALYALANGESRLIGFWKMFHQEGEPTNIYSFNATTPDCLTQYIEEVDGNFRNVMREAGYSDGVGWIEMIKDEDGHFYVLEAGYRLSGEMLPSPIAEISGFDPVGWYVDTALGIKHDWIDLPSELIKPYEKTACSYMLWAKKDGIIKKLIGLDILRNKMKSLQIDFLRNVGSEVKKYSPMGEILFVGEDPENICEILQQINNTIKIEDEKGEDILIRFTGYEELINDPDK